MFSAETEIRIHYALTDQMGFVYHGHYAQFYEIGRTEAIRSLGYTYKDIESMGIIMPVIETRFKFLLHAKYDDLIKVKTMLKEMPDSHRIVFHGEIYNQKGQLLNVGEVTMYFMQIDGMKKIPMPEELKNKVEKYFKWCCYLPEIPSTLAFPGPISKIAKNAPRYNAAISPLPKKSALCTLNKATDMQMMIGTEASLVNKPITMNKPQKNSANTTSNKEIVLPSPIKLMNEVFISAK